jgi:hypothetical protein
VKLFDRKVREQLRELEHKLDILEVYFTIRDPGTARSAEAFDGLRKTLINANKTVLVHRGHLIELDRLTSTTDDIGLVRVKVSELMQQMGIDRFASPDSPDAYEITEGTHGILRVDRPAYIDVQSGQLLARGSAHYEPSAPAPPTVPENQSAVAPVVDSAPIDSESAPVQEEKGAGPEPDGTTGESR